MFREAVVTYFFKLQWNSLPYFRRNERKSGSSIVIIYLWPMEVKVRNKSSIITIYGSRKLKVRVPENIVAMPVRSLMMLCAKSATLSLKMLSNLRISNKL